MLRIQIPNILFLTSANSVRALPRKSNFNEYFLVKQYIYIHSFIQCNNNDSYGDEENSI